MKYPTLSQMKAIRSSGQSFPQPVSGLVVCVFVVAAAIDRPYQWRRKMFFDGGGAPIF